MNADELAGLPIGTRIQAIRERQGKSRPVVANLVGRSAQWLKDVERGRRLPPRWDMLVALASVLHVDVTTLTGTGSAPISAGLQRREGHPVVSGLREAIESTPFRFQDDGPEPDVRALLQRAADAWHLWHTSPTPRASAGALLPQLVRDGRRAARVTTGKDRRTAHMALTSAYALAEQVLAWVADSALLWLAADRCMTSAQEADRPEPLAGAAWVLGNVWRATGREEDAYRLANDAADLLEPYLASGPDDSRALWGSVRLHAAITAARMGEEGNALHALDEGEEMARRMPRDFTHPWTLFGTANTMLTAVSVHVDMRKSASALERADAVDPDSVPSVDRRARLWLEMSRSYHQKRDSLAALHTLQRATDISEESMRCHPLSRGLAGELVTSGGRLVERDARNLATRLGLTV
ncbi:helix-turn-helix transcriptional regulator [Saccharopolyspora cebuensis]|uniref:Helix-turn-helix domain-containing protein n=1 Tax=Saccharopolyspora cebuensis TaxID=418759 RepID=A0ABV4CKT9_9PSEU